MRTRNNSYRSLDKARSQLSKVLFAAALAVILSTAAFAQMSSRYPKQFSAMLHEHAIKQSPDIGPRYFAIIRRGMQEFERLQQQLGPSLALRQFSPRAINEEPEAQDRNLDTQHLLSLRLGIDPRDRNRITRGWPVSPKAYENVVALGSSEYSCTGVVVDANTVLTAAHCACDLKLYADEGTSNNRAKRIYITHDLADSQRRVFQVDIKATRFLAVELGEIHPCATNGLRASVLSGYPDLAIVKSTALMPIAPMRIATPEYLAKTLAGLAGRSPYFILGFGCSKPIQSQDRYLDCPLSLAKRKEMAAIYNGRNCFEGYCGPSAIEFVLQDRLTNRGTSADTCLGDSGGPAIIHMTDGVTSHVLLAGITSRALHPGQLCGVGGIYGKVATQQVLGWLKKNDVRYQH